MHGPLNAKNRGIFILESPHCKQAFAVFFASYSCFLLFRDLEALDASLISPSPSIIFKTTMALSLHSDSGFSTFFNALFASEFQRDR